MSVKRTATTPSGGAANRAAFGPDSRGRRVATTVLPGIDAATIRRHSRDVKVVGELNNPDALDT